MADRLSRRWVLFLAAAGVLALAAAGVYTYEARGEQSPVARGARLAHTSGCFACHGSSEEEHRANFRQVSGGGWRAKGIPSLWENGIDEADELITWIAQGSPPEERERHQQLFLQMPAYERFLQADEIDAIAAWILAEGLHRWRGSGADAAVVSEDLGRDLTVEELWHEGDRLSRVHGCYQCHGELGQGGVPNPASFKGYIPGFFGSDFLALTDGGEREEILHWIQHGRGRRIETGPLGPVARRFFAGQAIGMPAYKERLTEREMTLLTDYVLLLHAQGPLGAAAIEAIADRLAEPPATAAVR